MNGAMDRFDTMVQHLLGEPLPLPSQVRGRVHRLPPIPEHGDPGLADIEAAETWRALARETAMHEPQADGDQIAPTSRADQHLSADGMSAKPRAAGASTQ